LTVAMMEDELETVDERLPFGELAVLEEMVTRDQLSALLARQLDQSKYLKIGTLLVREGYLSKRQGKRILKIQKQHGPIEGYQLLEHLGSGGMGSVFRATQEETGRELAVKILPPRATRDSRYRTRFLREATLLQQLNHPNLVRCFAQGESNDHLYYAMQLVPGQTGRAMLKTHGFIHEEDLRSFLRQMLLAMEHYWERRIVHRDIKPENIMFTPDGQVKLTDLGLSRQLDDGVHITRVGKTLGTPLYISPELAQGRSDIDIRSDLYSLGATFFHMATGIPPFYANSQAELLKMHVEDPAPRPRDKNPDLSEGMEQVILCLLEKDEEDRFDDPTKALEALDRLERGEAPVPRRRRRLSSTGQTAAVPGRRASRLGSSSARTGWQPKAPPRSGPELTPLFVILGFAALFAVGVLLGSNGGPDAAAQAPVVVGAKAPNDADFRALLGKDPAAAARSALVQPPSDLGRRIERLELAAKALGPSSPQSEELLTQLATLRPQLEQAATAALEELRTSLIDLVDEGRFGDARRRMIEFPAAYQQVPGVREAYEELGQGLELAARDASQD
jgi:serine/threonine-protein kinase